MAELKDEWEPPESTSYAEQGWVSWMLRDTSRSNGPWAWITRSTNDTQYHLERWTGRTWEPHAVFDTLEDAKAVGRIVAGIDMRRLKT
jgi:hypothetical protein